MSTQVYALAAAALLLLSATVPAGAKCLDDVHAMAEAHGVSSRPPVAAPDSKQSPPVTTHDLARSGGVIAPPPTADNSVIKPSGNPDPGMKTVPDAKTSTPAPAAARQTALQAALTAARADAERGDEQACRDSLAKARQLAERK